MADIKDANNNKPQAEVQSEAGLELYPQHDR